MATYNENFSSVANTITPFWWFFAGGEIDSNWWGSDAQQDISVANPITTLPASRLYDEVFGVMRPSAIQTSSLYNEIPGIMKAAVQESDRKEFIQRPTKSRDPFSWTR